MRSVCRHRAVPTALNQAARRRTSDQPIGDSDRPIEWRHGVNTVGGAGYSVAPVPSVMEGS